MSSRLSKILAAVCCITVSGACISQAQDQLQRKLKYETPGTTLKTALESIQNATGIELACDPQFQKEIVVVRVTSVTVGDLLDRFAKITAGKWQKTSNGYRLVQDLKTEREIESRISSYRKTAIAKAVKDFFNEANPNESVDYERLAQKARDLLNQINIAISSNSDYENLTEQLTAMGKSGPIKRALARLVASLPTDLLEGIGPGTRLVLSSNPTRMQSAFPASSRAVLNQFYEEHNAWAKGLVASDSSVGTENTSSRMWSSNWPDVDAKRAEPGELVFVLNLSRYSYREPIDMKLTIGDKRGLALDSATGFLDPKIVQPPGKGPTFEKRKLSIDEDALQFAKLLRGVYSTNDTGGSEEFSLQVLDQGVSSSISRGDSPEDKFFARPRVPIVPVPNVSPKLLTWLMSPNQHEPIGIIYGPLIVQAVNDPSVSIVGLLPDKLVGNVTPISTITDESLWQTLMACDLRIANEDGWLTITPEDPVRLREQRIDRDALAKLLKSGSSGLYSGRAIAAYSTTRKLVVEDYPGLDMRYVRATFGRVVNAFNVSESFSYQLGAWRMLGALSASQWDALQAGEQIRLTAPALPLGKFASEALYATSIPREISIANAPAINPETMTRRGGFFNGYLGEDPTISFPNGIGTDMMLTEQTVSSLGCIAFRADNEAPAILTADDLGYLMGITDGNPVRFNKFRAIKYYSLKLSIVGSDGTKATISLEDAAFDPAYRAAGGFETMPQTFRDRVATAKQMFHQGGV